MIPPPPPEIVAGEDLAALRAIVEEAPEDPAGWADLLVRFPSSPLAELAWGRLVELGALEETLRAHPELRPWADGLDRSWRAHQAALDRTPVTVVVADLSTPPGARVPPEWTLGAGVVGGWAGKGIGQVDVRLRRGPITGLLTLGTNGLGLGARLGAAPFVQVAADTTGRLAATFGGTIPLPVVDLEIAVGTAWTADGLVPAVTLGASFQHLLPTRPHP